MKTPSSAARALALAAALAAGALIAGCAPVVVGGAVAGSTMVATDRRSAGTQLDDSTNELKALSAAETATGAKSHVNATSYNRIVLLTGEVPSEAAKAAAGKAVAGIATVRSVVNDLAAMPDSSIATRSEDTILTGKVKAAIFDTPGLSVASIKVVTERGEVYLMGLVTEAEAARAAEAARVVGGVRKVVRVFQIITPAELAAFEASLKTDAAATGAAPAKP